MTQVKLNNYHDVESLWSIMERATTEREAVQLYLDMVDAVQEDSSEAARLIAQQKIRRDIYHIISVVPDKVWLRAWRVIK